MGTTVLVGDDGGVCAGIDDALIELVNAGVLDRCEAVVNYPESVELVRRLAKSVELGLHVNLSSGSPVSDPAGLASITYGASFMNPAEWVTANSDPRAALGRLRYEARMWDVEQVAIEVRAQLDLFTQITDQRPGFVSVHHDLDEVASVAESIRAVAMMPGRADQLQSGELATYRYRFATKETTSESWKADLESQLCENNGTEGTHLIACHPSKTSDGFEAFSAYRQGRVVEYRALRLLAKSAGVQR